MVFRLSLEEGEFLVRLARKAVENYLETKETTNVPDDTPQKLLKPCGVFVTIRTAESSKRKLRGCIGYPYPSTPLTKAVIESSINSATQDPRFQPLSPKEIENVVFELSVLTPPEKINVEKPIEYPSKIKVGKDGLIVEKGLYKGLLLPQVPVEWKWDSQTFLCQCCMKASLPPDCWLLKNTSIYKFQAIIFEEESPRGEVKRKAFGGK